MIARNRRVDANFERHLRHLAGMPYLRFCQIGVYMGDMTLWMMEHILTHPRSTLDDVDPWIEGYDGQTPATVEAEYRQRVKDLGLGERGLRTCKMRSGDYFSVRTSINNLDFVYIDGDHRAHAVLEDAVDAWRRLRRGGIIAFDDYDRTDTGRGIDAFLSVYNVAPFDEPYPGVQCWIQKP